MTKLAKVTKLLTYEEVISGIIEQEPQDAKKAWNYYVDSAKTLLTATYFNRMAVAEVALWYHELSDKQLEMVSNACRRILAKCVEIQELRKKVPQKAPIRPELRPERRT